MDYINIFESLFQHPEPLCEKTTTTAVITSTTTPEKNGAQTERN